MSCQNLPFATCVFVAVFCGCSPQQHPLASDTVNSTQGNQTATSVEVDEIGGLMKRQGYSCVTLERLRSRYLSVQATVAKYKLRLVLDTGAPVTHLDPERTQPMNLKWDKLADVVPAENRSDTDTFLQSEVDGFDFGTLKTRRVIVGVHRFVAESKQYVAYGDPPLDGLLGADILSSYGARIDYPTLRLFLRRKQAIRSEESISSQIGREVLPTAPDAADFSPGAAKSRGASSERPGQAKLLLANPGDGATTEEIEEFGRLAKQQGYTCAPLDFLRSGHIAVSVQIAGQKLRFMLDTGAPLSCVDCERTKALNLKWSKLPGVAPAKNERDWDPSLRAELGVLDIGWFKTHPISVGMEHYSTINASLEPIGESPIDGVLGSDFLTAYSARIDYPACRLYLRADH
jgi:predicted aspartyl protease